MVRTLPWLKNAATSEIQPSKPHPAKRQRALDQKPYSDSDENAASCAIVTKKKEKALRADRTPTTSPPPAPPPTSPLRPGLNADDIYMMVEDEFLSTARLFTAHLHHAEYVRLKNEAKKRNVDGIERIERPIDSITEMRAETRKKKEAERQEARAKAAVDKVMPAARREKGEGSDGSESEFDEGERHDDPWQGTQLQHFMTKSPRKELTGLTGLQGVVSNTRAAAGLARAERRTPLNAQNSPTKKTGRTNQSEKGVEDETDQDTDDLDAPSHRKMTMPRMMPGGKHASLAKHREVKETPKARLPSPPRPPPQRAFLDVTLTPRSPPSSKPPVRAEPQPAPEPLMKQETSNDVLSARERLEARRKAKARREKTEKERLKRSTGIGVDEIPVFLI